MNDLILSHQGFLSALDHLQSELFGFVFTSTRYRDFLHDVFFCELLTRVCHLTSSRIVGDILIIKFTQVHLCSP